MILRYYGKARSITNVTRELGTTEDGTDQYQIRNLLIKRGLIPRRINRPTIAKLRHAIDAGCPVLVGLDSKDTECGHWAVVYGYAGKPRLWLACQADGTRMIHVEFNLIDPFQKIRSGTICYLFDKKLSQMPKSSDRLNALPGCQQVPLKIDDRVAAGSFPVWHNSRNIRLQCQGLFVDESGAERYVPATEETVGSNPPALADDTAPSTPPENGGQRKPDHAKRAGAPSLRPGLPSGKFNAGGASLSPQEVALLVSSLNSANMGLRIRAMAEVQKRRSAAPNAAVAAALERVLLRDSQSPLRCGAVVALKDWGGPQNIPALEAAAERDPDSTVRAFAAKSVEAIKQRQ
jgi:hypothetical protein